MITKLEDCLFKYGPFEYAERTLTNLTLPFSDLGSYNDIYEDEFRLILNVRRDSVARFNEATIPTAIAIRNTFESQLKKYSVTCFSNRADISLMWSHYADRHMGVCYCFDSTHPDPIFENPISRGHVKYTNRLPDINVYQDHTTDSMVRNMVSDVVLTKPIEWAYEQEYRFWYDSSVLEEPKFDPLSLKALIVGRRVTSSQLESINLAVEKYNTEHGTEVEILYAYRKKEVYDLGICAKKLKRDWSEVSQNNASVITISQNGNFLLS